MASRSEHTPSLTSISPVLNDEKDSFPHDDRPPPSLPTAIDPVPLDTDVTYPEGGRDAWLVVLGAWCGLTASIGIYNTAGVFQVVISEVVLPEESPSTLGWIFSIYAFVVWIFGVQVGPTFDAMGPRALMIAGTVCTLVGIFFLSVSKGKISTHTILYCPSNSRNNS